MTEALRIQPEQEMGHDQHSDENSVFPVIVVFIVWKAGEGERLTWKHLNLAGGQEKEEKIKRNGE